MKTVTKQNGITEGVIIKQLLLFFFPIVFGIFFQQLYSMIDAVIVGKVLGKEALSAVGGGTSALVNVFGGFFVGLSSGCTVVIAQYYGANKPEKVSKAVHTSIAFSIVSGIFLMIFGVATANWALILMRTPTDIFDYSLTYLTIYYMGMIPNILYNIGTGILRAVGDSKRPLYFLIVGCITNIILDILFVAVLNMGVWGVAIATVISQTVCAVLLIVSLKKTTNVYKLYFSRIKFDGYILKKIILIGVPAGLQAIFYTGSNLIIQTVINTFGTDVVAAWAVYGKVDGIYWMIIESLGIAMTTFVGQNFGAGKFDRVRKSVRQCLIFAAVFTIVLSVIFYAGGEKICWFFTNDETVISIGVSMMHFLVPTYITYILIEILSGALRGMGDAVIPTIIACVGVCGIRIMWLITAVPAYRTIEMVMLSYPVSWSIASICFTIYYLFRTSKLKNKF